LFLFDAVSGGTTVGSEQTGLHFAREGSVRAESRKGAMIEERYCWQTASRRLKI
jgi:hypothetical protein